MKEIKKMIFEGTVNQGNYGTTQLGETNVIDLFDLFIDKEVIVTIEIKEN
jgi:hypothetical protein